MSNDSSKNPDQKPEGEHTPPSPVTAKVPEAPAPIVRASAFGAGTMAGGANGHDGRGGKPGMAGQADKQRGRGVPWRSFTAVIYALLVFLMSQFAAVVILLLAVKLRGWNMHVAERWINESTVAQFWYVLLAEALTFGGIWWFIRRRGAKLSIIGWKRPRWIDPAYALGAFVVYFLGLAVVMAIVTHLLPSLNVNQQQDLGFNNVTTNVNLLLTFVSLVVLPPIVEETVFRGFIFTTLRGRNDSRMRIIVAALIASLLFAAAHLQFGNGQPLLWVAGIDTFVLSLVLCYLRQRTDSLWPGIFLHALKNGVAFVALFVIGTS